MLTELLLAATITHWAVEPMSGIRRTYDTKPEGGENAAVRILAARGEYEPGSFVLLSDADLKDQEVKVSDLRCGAETIPASALDVKVVKVWFQQGTAWHGFHADSLRRVATPELLLHDEALVRSDERTKEDYVRADLPDGTQAYYWISYTGAALDHEVCFGSHNKWIHDATEIRPVALEKGRYKQFWLTLHVPADAKGGLYSGTVTVGGHAVPVKARVLPFALPRPGVFRDPKREFIVSAYCDNKVLNLADNPAYAKNLVAHNLLNPLVENIRTPEEAARLFRTIAEAGLDTNRVMTALPSADVTVSTPPEPDDLKYEEYFARLGAISNTMAYIRRAYGEAVTPYAYGVDEASLAKTRAQRSIWMATQAMGGRVIAASKWRPFALFAQDAVNFPMQPSASRKVQADLLHDSNPDALAGWYCDPHSGPENPEFTRRLYGWQTWRNGYDMVCQYLLFRNGWSEYWQPWEPNLRGLNLCYDQDGGIVDTLAWEAFREGIDDIRYGTLLKTLAEEARVSKDINVAYEGRVALTYLAQVPFETSSLTTIRYEMAYRIVSLLKTLGKEVR